MDTDSKTWKVPALLGMVVCSLFSIVLVTFIETLEVRGSAWVHDNRVVPFIARTFKDYYLVGLGLPGLTILAAIWLLMGKAFTVTKFVWVAFVAVLLHLVWFSYAALAFYLANQTFH